MDIDDMYRLVEEVIRRKKASKIVPAHALYVTDILRALDRKVNANEVKRLLNELCRQNKLRFGHTINDLYFEIKQQQ